MAVAVFASRSGGHYSARVDGRDCIVNLIRAELSHAIEMQQRALSLKTGTAWQVELEYSRTCRQRWCKCGATGSIQRDERKIQGRRHVHQTRVVGHDYVGEGQQIHSFVQGRATA